MNKFQKINNQVMCLHLLTEELALKCLTEEELDLVIETLDNVGILIMDSALNYKVNE